MRKVLSGSVSKREWAARPFPFNSLNSVHRSAVILLTLMAQVAMGGPRDAQWRTVEEAVSKGKPRTAITNLEPIIEGALADRAYAEAAKAIGKKIALEGTVEGNKPEEKITRLEAEIAKAPKEMTPILDTLLAHWYWQYFQQNRWRFMQRTATAEAPGKDFTTWDLPRLFGEIDKQFQHALAAEQTLKATPIGAWDDLLETGTMPDSYRPTLYDFIAHEALQFYTTPEQAGAKPEDAFELSADSPALDSVEGFLAWQPGSATPGSAGIMPARSTNDAVQVSHIVRAIHVFQALLRFHQSDPAPHEAFASDDLERLSWAWNTAFGEEKNARYKAALEGFVRKYADIDLSALALEHEARVLQQEGDLLGAHKMAERGLERFPDSPGGRLCRNLIRDIESKSVSISTERVWQCRAGVAPGPDRRDACPTLMVRYRNISSVYFRAIPYDWETFLQRRHNRVEYMDEKERRQILATKPVLEWSEKLARTSDYKEKGAQFLASDKLKPGFYFIAASIEPGFGEKENMVSMTTVWVSGLSLVTRTRAGWLEGFVVEADSGEPVPGAAVSVWHWSNWDTLIADTPLSTDANGMFAMKMEQSRNQARNYLVRARYKDQELASGDGLAGYWQRSEGDSKPYAQTFFFTDRSIYRPGQTVQYKGICVWVDQAKNNYEVLKGEAVTVSFRDANDKEIARQTHQANDYGSFSGSFTAPRDRLMGRMTLRVEGRANGQAFFNVEEYKRPKFQVTLDAPKPAAKLNEKVILTGHAMAYTGAAVDGAPVRYRVVREVRMPWWWGWWGRPFHQSESQEIAHGTATSETDGTFKIEFTARPDPKVPEKDEPKFVFHITADVTDSAGETRSADREVRVGYTALEATMDASDWQTDDKPVEIKLGTKTLDEEPQAAKGTLKVHALKAPERVHRAPLDVGQYNVWVDDQDGAVQVSDRSERSDQSDPKSWPLGEVVAETSFQTGTNGLATTSFKLRTGAYRVLLETQDRFGKKVTGKLQVLVLRPEDHKLAIKVPHLLSAPEWGLQPGRQFMALWGTGYGTGRAFVEIERRNQITERYWTKPGQTQQQIEFVVTEAMRGGFTLHVTQIRENRAYLNSRKIEVPWKNKDLELTWEHFVSKLQPGQKETWTLKIQGPKAGVQSPKSKVQSPETEVHGPQSTVHGQKPKVQGPRSEGEGIEGAVAELVAALYDESLDAFAPHEWSRRFSVFYEDGSTVQATFANSVEHFAHILGNWREPRERVLITYRHFPSDLTANLWGYEYRYRYLGGLGGGGGGRFGLLKSADAGRAVPQLAAAAPAEAEQLADRAVNGLFTPGLAKKEGPAPPGAGEAGTPSRPDLGQVTARKNLNETAFFYPQLTSDSNGIVGLTFTMPEALTKWRFLAFAHDRSLRGGYIEDHAVTAKDLMVQPNPPRFLREGDTVEFTVKVSNQSDKEQTGSVRLSFSDALTGRSADAMLGLEAGSASAGTSPGQATRNTEHAFTIPAKESRSCSWTITVPDGCGFLTYKAVGAAPGVSDGEEGAIPVLSRRILITESLPLPIRGPATKKFEFTKLLKSADSKTLQNKSLTVQMASNPAWYAVMALPYLMEFPHECSEQIFNRLYANALARSIAKSDPKIHRVFEQWRNTPTLESPLEKNQDLKNVALEETPWVRQAESETQARKNVGILFDDNRLDYESQRTAEKLAQMQLPDGSWPWFPGGHGNDYITLYITTGFGRLRHLSVEVDIAPAVRSLDRLDGWMDDEYQRIQKWPEPDKYVPSYIDALYLYGRSFFLKDKPIAAPHQKAIAFFLAQARKFWLETNCRQTQGQLAIALLRFNSFNSFNDSTPNDIMVSIRERSVSNEEMGMFWRDTELSWWWYRAPIETQALMIEAFDEVAHDAKGVEECKVWLLKQKQTQDWKTTKATADAVYALLLRGRNVLSSDALVEVKLDDIDVTPEVGEIRNPKSEIRRKAEGPKSEEQGRPEAGTGFYEYRFAAGDIKPALGEITVHKTDEGVAWGGVHWQYLEDMSKVTPYEGTPLKLKKSLFIKTNTGRGPVLEPAKDAVGVGDELVVRIELRVDRDMEYVHLKDQRGSGTEPVNVSSHYKYQDGLAYYESTRDTASHFFIDYLPKGVYVFEYSTRVQLRGHYQTGVAEIQCMYAPEFNSHSESLPVVVR